MPVFHCLVAILNFIYLKWTKGTTNVQHHYAKMLFWKKKDMKVITVLLFRRKKIAVWELRIKFFYTALNFLMLYIQFTYVLQSLNIYKKYLNIGLEKIIFCLHLNFNKFLPYKHLKICPLWFFFLNCTFLLSSLVVIN